jgi:gamma-glutamyl-gamma-aminobutyraldehyde dehydrogenase
VALVKMSVYAPVNIWMLMVSFTGLTEVGRLFLQYPAQSNLKEIVQNAVVCPQIVSFDDAVLDDAAINDILSRVLNMSENCSCVAHAYLVHSNKTSVT